MQEKKKIIEISAGDELRDKASPHHPDDDFNNMFSTKDGKNIETSGGIRRIYFSSGDPAFITQKRLRIPAVLILVTGLINNKDNKWIDDYVSPNLTYHGDNKIVLGKKATAPIDRRGCKNLMCINEISGVSGSKSLIPPILYFHRTKVGYLVFNGIFALKGIEFYEIVKGVNNIKANLQLINSSVDMDWIRQRASQKNILDLEKLDKQYNYGR
jgi:hypothetical protein